VKIAEDMGFEPTVGRAYNGFQDISVKIEQRLFTFVAKYS